MLSIVVPTLDESEQIVAHLDALAALRARGHEVIVVDGGSRDGTEAACAGRADRVLASPRGRARQMNAGAAVARGEVLVFLHADTRLPAGADAMIFAALDALDQTVAAQPGGAGVHGWGRFDVRIAGRSRLFPLIARLMNLRSRVSGIATGDQAIFVRRDWFERIGGYAELALMEDIDLARRLRALAPPACLRARVVTSGRRWDSHGVWRTIWLMWRLRWRFWRGASADELARAYS